MKTLDLFQMENLQGGVNGRNCMIIGAVIGGSAIVGFFCPAAWAVTAGAVIAGAGVDCF